MLRGGGSTGGSGGRGFNYNLTAPALTTSAAIYDANGVLQKTLWSGLVQSAGPQTGYWAGDNDAGQPATGVAPFHARVLAHNVTYTWEGVIGNLSSSFTGSAVMGCLNNPVMGLSISGSNLWVSIGYNEGQPCVAQFATSAVNTKAGGMLPDARISPNNIATDASNLYFGCGGGIGSTLSFVAVQNLSTGNNVALSSGTATLGTYSAIDVTDLSVTPLAVISGISVSSSFIAVAHGGLGVVRIFNKTTGAAVNSISVASMSNAAQVCNQLAFDPSGNLWVISGTSVVEYTNPGVNSTTGTTITGFSNPLAVATDSSGNVWIADGNSAQQIFKYNSSGTLQSTFGTAGGYATSPAVSATKFWFYWPDASWTQTAAICPDSSGGIWIADVGNLRTLHFTSSGTNDLTMQWSWAAYNVTVDHSVPTRVFLGYLEYTIDYTKTLTAGPSQTAWTLTNNWTAGGPSGPFATINNGLHGGFSAVETLSNNRTYAMAGRSSGQARDVYELPASGLPRLSVSFAAPSGGNSQNEMYENGDIRYINQPSVANGVTQTFYVRSVTGFDGFNNPIWGTPTSIATVTTTATNPWFRAGGFGDLRPCPISSSNNIICFDGTTAVVAGTPGNEGYHLGGVANGGTNFLWQASPTGALNGLGVFQTKAIDGTVNYGGNQIWVSGQNVFYGYHGENFTSVPVYNQIGEANQFMHFYDDGLFIGQFGVENIAHFNTGNHPAGCAGNSFSNTYAIANNILYWYHGDESVHGGVHRWRIDGINTITEQTIVV